MQPPQNYASAAYLPRRLEQTAPADQLGQKRTMSGTGSLGPGSRVGPPTNAAATYGNLVLPERGVYSRKQDTVPAATLQPVTQTA
jgi:hypothetical protein